jgi:hypothetical protein
MSEKSKSRAGGLLFCIDDRRGRQGGDMKHEKEKRR